MHVVLYSKLRENEARVVIDSGSHRSHIRSDVAKFLGYTLIATNEATHSFFGGLNMDSQLRNVLFNHMRSREK